MNKSLRERKAVSTEYYQKQWTRAMAGNGSAEEAGIRNIMQRPLHSQSKKLRFDLRDMGCPDRVLYKDNTVI